MAIIGHFDYSRKWTSPDDFPTYEASEEQVRADMQALFDEISAYLNGTLIDWVEEQVSSAITGQIPDRSLPSIKLKLRPVDPDEPDESITGAEISSKTIGLINMDDDSIDSDQYVDGSIDPEHLADDAVTLRAMADESVDSDQYVDYSIDPEHLADDAVTLRAMADNSVDSDQYVDYSIDPEHLADDAVTTRAIEDGAVTDAKLAKAKADLDSDGKVKASQASSKIVTVTASRALDLSDAGKFLMCNSSSAITITIPAAATVAFPAGTELEFCRYGTGALTFTPAAGVTIRSLYSSLTAGDQYACVALKKLNTDVWILTGSLE